MRFELDIIHWLQGFRSQFLDLFFTFITFFGEEIIIIGILGVIYWCINKEIGKRFALVVFISTAVNSVLKIIILRERPFIVDESIENLREHTAGSYSMPSGHTQGAATTFFLINYYYKKKALLIFAIVITILVGISRMYIGVHYLTDVLLGGLIGVGLVYGINAIINRFKNMKKIYIITSIIFSTIYLISVIVHLINASQNSIFLADTFYFNLETLSKMTGALIGFIMGVFFEERYVNFTNHKHFQKNIIRILIGIIIVMGIRIGLKAFFDLFISTSSFTDIGDTHWLQPLIAIIFDFLRYGIMVFVGLAVYPMLFNKVNI